MSATLGRLISRHFLSTVAVAVLGAAPCLAQDATQPAGNHAAVKTPWADSVRRALAARMHRVAEEGRTALAWSQHGVASWYGARFHGRRTESGAIFDRNALTAAHPTLPIGTKLLVRSEDTGRSVVVTVNDRGPFNHRIIDLSRAAAERIGMVASGTARVALTPLPAADQPSVEVAQAADEDTPEQAIAASVPLPAASHIRRR
ncbi:rare lipoprotein A [Tanticharoenia sakaeratensis NBRC 103193]|uniref:Endolytic peptidoglycan transglycosylase RlpA n=2 Tax=Tanticharoenia TaxID=444052 RepID=A0A0D6MHM1_9PROT|nr:rare lipoprotein A [Tanticharoenia sakaeratensis NBRC 103193]